MTFDGRVNRGGRTQTWIGTFTNGAAGSGEAATLHVSTGGWSGTSGSHTANDGWTGIIYTGLGLWTVQEAGTYDFDACRMWATGTGRRLMFFWINQATPTTSNAYRRFEWASNSVSMPSYLNLTAELSAGDTIKYGWYHTHSDALLATATAGPMYDGVNQSNYFQITRRG